MNRVDPNQIIVKSELEELRNYYIIIKNKQKTDRKTLLTCDHW